MDFSKVDPQWLIGQGIAVFLCVALFLLVLLMMRVIVRELRNVQVGLQQASKIHVEKIGNMIGAIRWLGETIRKAMGLDPPKSYTEGFGNMNLKKGQKPPGRKPDGGTPTPSVDPINFDDLMSGDG